MACRSGAGFRISRTDPIRRGQFHDTEERVKFPSPLLCRYDEYDIRRLAATGGARLMRVVGDKAAVCHQGEAKRIGPDEKHIEDKINPINQHPAIDNLATQPGERQHTPRDLLSAVPRDG
jgi:hypothetical protein